MLLLVPQYNASIHVVMCFSRIFTIKIQPLLCIAAEQQLHGKIGKTDCEAPAASIQKKCNTILYLFRTKLAHARGFRDFLNYLGICSLKKFNTIKIIPRGVTLLRLYYFFQISLTCDYLGRNEPHLQISPNKKT